MKYEYLKLSEAYKKETPGKILKKGGKICTHIKGRSVNQNEKLSTKEDIRLLFYIRKREGVSYGGGWRVRESYITYKNGQLIVYFTLGICISLLNRERGDEQRKEYNYHPTKQPVIKERVETYEQRGGQGSRVYN